MSNLSTQIFNNIKQFFSDLFNVRFNFNMFPVFPKEYFSNEVELDSTHNLNNFKKENETEKDENKTDSLDSNTPITENDNSNFKKIIDLASILSPSSFDPQFLLNNIETLFLIFTNPEFSLSSINNHSIGNLKTELISNNENENEMYLISINNISCFTSNNLTLLKTFTNNFIHFLKYNNIFDNNYIYYYHTKANTLFDTNSILSTNFKSNSLTNRYFKGCLYQLNKNAIISYDKVVFTIEITPIKLLSTLPNVETFEST